MLYIGQSTLQSAHRRKMLLNSCLMANLNASVTECGGKQMKIALVLLLTMLAGCTKVSEAELQTKINACTSAGMNYTYLNDWRGKPYDVMCVAKRVR